MNISVVDYLFAPLKKIEERPLSPPTGFLRLGKQYLIKYSTPFFSGFLATVLSYWSIPYIGHDYLYLAAKQAVSPLFWNMLFVVGAFLACLSMMTDNRFSRKISRLLSNASKNVFLMAASIGALMLGTLSGMFINAISGAEMTAWGMIGHSVLASLLLGYSVFLNIFVWWLALCFEDSSYMPPYFSYIASKPLLKFIYAFCSSLGLIALVIFTEPSAAGGL